MIKKLKFIGGISIGLVLTQCATINPVTVSYPSKAGTVSVTYTPK